VCSHTLRNVQVLAIAAAQVKDGDGDRDRDRLTVIGRSYNVSVWTIASTIIFSFPNLRSQDAAILFWTPDDATWYRDTSRRDVERQSVALYSSICLSNAGIAESPRPRAGPWFVGVGRARPPRDATRPPSGDYKSGPSGEELMLIYVAVTTAFESESMPHAQYYRQAARSAKACREVQSPPE
jgi:hypothetical protein